MIIVNSVIGVAKAKTLMLEQFKNLKTLLETFPDEQSCVDFLFELRPDCPHCEHKKVWRFSDGRRFKCAGCKRQFTMKTGTIFAASNISIRQWFIIYYLNIQNKKGMSSYNVAEEAEVTQKTAWHRLMCVRNALGQDQPTQMAGVVEADETYSGGKNKNRHYKKRVKGNSDKTIVFGMLSRSSGKVRAIVVPDRDQKTLETEIYKVLHKNSTIITDDHGGYRDLQGYNHLVLNRSAYQYVVPDGLIKSGYRRGMHRMVAAKYKSVLIRPTLFEKIYKKLFAKTNAHNNNIEGFWPFIDRPIYGIYHNISPKHLQFYSNECTFRFNTRKHTRDQRMKLALSYIYGEKITYQEIKERKDPRVKKESFRFRPPQI